MQAVFFQARTNSLSSVGTSRPAGALLRVIGALMLVTTALAQPAAAATRYAQALPSTGAPARSLFVAPTGKMVQGDFLSTYERFGLERIGYPVSDQVQENGLTVQYFERVRMEYHPELSNKGYSVLLTRLGSELTQNTPFAPAQPFRSTNAKVFVKETNHSLSEPFLSYWRNNGSVELFGYPISEPVVEDGMTVQWFERTRMEYHPDLAKSGNAVQLSLLGRVAYESKGGRAPAASAANQAVPAGQPVSAQAAAGPAAMESYLLQAFNEQRAAAGLAPVRWSDAIRDLSRARSNDMATRNYFSHTTPEGAKFLEMLGQRGIRYKYAGEILARNNYPDAEAARVAAQSYLGSAPHKAIILDGRYNLVGIGYAKSDEDGMHYFTVIFVQQ